MVSCLFVFFICCCCCFCLFVCLFFCQKNNHFHLTVEFLKYNRLVVGGLLGHFKFNEINNYRYSSVKMMALIRGGRRGMEGDFIQMINFE